MFAAASRAEVHPVLLRWKKSPMEWIRDSELELLTPREVP